MLSPAFLTIVISPMRISWSRVQTPFFEIDVAGLAVFPTGDQQNRFRRQLPARLDAWTEVAMDGPEDVLGESIYVPAVSRLLLHFRHGVPREVRGRLCSSCSRAEFRKQTRWLPSGDSSSVVEGYLEHRFRHAACAVSSWLRNCFSSARSCTQTGLAS